MVVPFGFLLRPPKGYPPPPPKKKKHQQHNNRGEGRTFLLSTLAFSLTQKDKTRHTALIALSNRLLATVLDKSDRASLLMKATEIR